MVLKTTRELSLQVDAQVLIFFCNDSQHIIAHTEQWYLITLIEMPCSEQLVYETTDPEGLSHLVLVTVAISHLL